MTKFYRAFLAIGAFLSGTQTLNAEVPQKVSFGALSELSGPGALNGVACQNGYKIAAALFAEHSPEAAKRVDIVFGDHRREQKAAISEFERLESLGVWGVACNHSIVGVAINPRSREKHIPLFGVMGHESFIRDNPYAYRVIPTPDEEGGGLARLAIARGSRKAAILLLEDDYILALGSAFEKQFKEKGEIVYKDSMEESLNDFSSIAAKIRLLHPDIIAMTLGFQQFGPAIKRLREQGIRQPIYSNYWLSYPQVIEAARPENVEGSVYVTEKSDYPVFVRAYSALAPDTFRSGVVFRCYTALSFALSAYAQLPPDSTRDDYSRFLAGLTKLDLPDRSIRIENHEVRFDPEYYVIKNGQPELLDSGLQHGSRSAAAKQHVSDQ